MSQTLSRLLKIVSPINPLEKILIPNVPSLTKKLQSFQASGIDNCEILTDFDYTLTRSNALGFGGKTSVTIAQTTNKPTSRMQEVQALLDYYSPIEHSLLVPQHIKLEKMKEWWFRSSAMLIGDKLEAKDIQSLVKDSNVFFRNGIVEVLEACKEFSVPFNVVSAGFGNVVEGFFQELGLGMKIKVFANFLLPDKDGKLAIRTEPFIVSAEKHKAVAGVEVRKNVLVLGDMITDCLVLEELEYEEAIKIGFFNRGDERMMEKFMEIFDVVVVNDGNLLVVEKILRAVAGESKIEKVLKISL